MKIPVLSLVLCMMFLPVAYAGELVGSLTNLEGEVRRNTPLTYQVQGRQVNSNERYQVQGPVDTSTNDLGQFRLPWADNYLPGTLEVFVQITSPGLQPVELQYLLGTTTHQVALVMRSSAFRQLLAARIGLYGARGTFHLNGLRGTALYYLRGARRAQLHDLEFVRTDYWYYYYDDASGRRWAIARRPHWEYFCVGGVWVCRVKHRIWTLGLNSTRWRYFDDAHPIIPAGTLPAGSSIEQTLPPP